MAWKCLCIGRRAKSSSEGARPELGSGAQVITCAKVRLARGGLALIVLQTTAQRAPTCDLARIGFHRVAQVMWHGPTEPTHAGAGGSYWAVSLESSVPSRFMMFQVVSLVFSRVKHFSVVRSTAQVEQ